MMKTVASLKAAVLCGVAPLVLGTVIFFAWVLTRADWLTTAGVLTILAGSWAVTFGSVFLVGHLWRSRRSRTVPGRRLVWQAIAVVALYVANFIGAGAAIWGVIAIETRYTVSITNRSEAPLEFARIEGGGLDIRFGTIAPGETVKHSMWIEQDGELVLKGTHGTEEIDATIDVLVMERFGEDKIVVLEADGTVKSSDRCPIELD